MIIIANPKKTWLGTYFAVVNQNAFSYMYNKFNKSWSSCVKQQYDLGLSISLLGTQLWFFEMKRICIAIMLGLRNVCIFRLKPALFLTCFDARNKWFRHIKSQKYFLNGSREVQSIELNVFSILHLLNMNRNYIIFLDTCIYMCNYSENSTCILYDYMRKKSIGITH